MNVDAFGNALRAIDLERARLNGHITRSEWQMAIAPVLIMHPRYRVPNPILAIMKETEREYRRYM